MANREDDKLIFTWMRSKVPISRIAAKLCMTEEQVTQRYKLLQEAINLQEEMGIDVLIERFNTTCFKYQILGEELKYLGQNLSNPVSPSEIRECIKEDPEQTVKALMGKFIILHPWKLEEPEDVPTEQG